MSHCSSINGRNPNPRPIQRGKDGRDAYEVWVSRQPDGADTSWCAYMNAIRGDDAYEVWVAHQPEGADTSWDAFMDAIHGPKGDKGDQGENGKAFVRRVVSGNISFDYRDNPANEHSTGMFGSSMYLKTTLIMYGVPDYSNNVMLDVILREMPCTEDGTLVPYNISAKALLSPPEFIPKVEVWFTFPTPPTHKMEPSSKIITKLTRGSVGLSGVSSIIPVDDTGGTVNEFHYELSYCYQE